MVVVSGPVTPCTVNSSRKAAELEEEIAITVVHEVAHFFGIPGPFRTSWQLMGGMDKLLLAYIRNPDFVLDLARIATDFNKAAVEMAADRGTDVITLQGDLAFNTSTLMSPDQYRKFLKPFTAEIVEFAHRKGLKAIKHSDGNLWPILEDLIEVGFDGLHPMEVKAGNDPLRMAEQYADRLVFIGGLDARILESGDQGLIRRQVAAYIDGMKARGGRLVFGSDHSLSTNIDYADFRAALDAWQEHCAY